MSQTGQYFYTVAGAAVICSVIRLMLPAKGSISTIGKMLCSIFLILTILKPVSNICFPDQSFLDGTFWDEAQTLVSQGKKDGLTEWKTGISQQVRAYILDKAAMFEADLDIAVVLSDDPIPMPVGVRITGNIAPYARKQLETMIERDLGIAKEDQQWN